MDWRLGYVRDAELFKDHAGAGLTVTSAQKRGIVGACQDSIADVTPQHVLTDLFDSDDFPAAISNPQEAAEIVIQRLIDAGFEIKASD